MSNQYANEPMLEMYIFETSQLLEQLEQAIIANEKACSYSQDAINEIFRFMHTIKGSSAMMLFNDIGALAHVIEDLFYFLREKKPKKVDYETLSDLVLEGVDFIKVEVEKIKSGDEVNISARSMGTFNVQLVMEMLGGGGHQTMAACQLKDISLEEAKTVLINAIDKYKKNIKQ